MRVTIEFSDPCRNDFVMEGPNVDYEITDEYLIITSDKFDEFPEKRVTFPTMEVFSITEESIH